MIRHSIGLLFTFLLPFQLFYQYQNSCLTLLILNGNFNKNYRLPFEGLYGGIKLKNHSFRKEELRKRDCFFHPQLNTNPIMARDFWAGNRNEILIEGVFLGQGICPE